MGPGENDARSRELLKDGMHRQVLLERCPAGGARVVKRFRSRGLLRRALDGRRARREHRLLVRLWQAEVPVPRPLELRSLEGAWELSTELLEGAVTLDDLLEGREALPASAERLASAIGRALAAAHVGGLDHRDLHAGNLMLDPLARAWLVDFGAASQRAQLSGSHLRRDLVSLAAATRERVSLRLRQRALLAWSRALPEELRATLPPPHELAADLERAARERRAAVLIEHRDRWLRVSGRCQRVDGRTLVTRLGERDEGLLAALEAPELSDRPIQPESGSTHEVYLFEGDARLRETFAELGRAYEHALPALRPIALRTGSPHRAAFGAPRGARRVPPGQAPPSESQARLRELLSDRGLTVDWEATPLWITSGGELLLGPGVRFGLTQSARGGSRG